MRALRSTPTPGEGPGRGAGTVGATRPPFPQPGTGWAASPCTCTGAPGGGAHVVGGPLLAVHGPSDVHAAGHGVDAEDLHGRLVGAHAGDAVADGDVVVFVRPDLGGRGGDVSRGGGGCRSRPTHLPFLPARLGPPLAFPAPPITGGLPSAPQDTMFHVKGPAGSGGHRAGTQDRPGPDARSPTPIKPQNTHGQENSSLYVVLREKGGNPTHLFTPRVLTRAGRRGRTGTCRDGGRSCWALGGGGGQPWRGHHRSDLEDQP